jgi:TolB-like protein/class 3 adenylate cyclase/Flp pilus assembly protein TadD
METPVTRRLAAILAADVVAYSRMMGADEEGTLARLRAVRREVTDPIVARHEGRIFKTMGDGLLVEFPSVQAAVRCAVEVQTENAARNAAVPAAQRIVFRIGINLGDVIGEGTDVFGDGVNIAARLEGICEPGGLAIGRNVYEQVQAKLPYAWQDAGPQRLKNIAEPVRVYRWREGARRGRSLPRPSRRAILAVVALIAILAGAVAAYRRGWIPAPSTAPRLSIVVLPFENLGRDPAQDYFADAITEDLITDLSRISGAFVIARNTSFTFKGRPVDVKRVAQDLNVRYLLEGSVQRQGPEVRVTVQLIDGETGAHVWSDLFDRTVDSVFALQNDVTGRLARTLNVELLEAESRRAQRGKPSNLDADDFAMRGQAALLKPVAIEANHEAIDWLRKAVEADPGSAEGWTGLAVAYAREFLIGWSTTPEETSRLALSAAERAVAVDPRSAESYAALALALRLPGQAEKAIAAAEKCIALNRNNAPCYGYKAFALIQTGRAEQSFQWTAKAFALSPQDPFTVEWLWYDAHAQLMLGHDAEAIQAARKASALNGKFQFPWQVAAAAHANRGEIDQARAALAEDLKVATPDMKTLGKVRAKFLVLAQSPTYIAQLERLFEGLRKAGMPEE